MKIRFLKIFKRVMIMCAAYMLLFYSLMTTDVVVYDSYNHVQYRCAARLCANNTVFVNGRRELIKDWTILNPIFYPAECFHFYAFE